MSLKVRKRANITVTRQPKKSPKVIAVAWKVPALTLLDDIRKLETFEAVLKIPLSNLFYGLHLSPREKSTPDLPNTVRDLPALHVREVEMCPILWFYGDHIFDMATFCSPGRVCLARRLKISELHMASA